MLAEAYTMMGTSSQKQRKSNLAREQFESAFKFVPDYAPAHNGIGHTLRMTGKISRPSKPSIRPLPPIPRIPSITSAWG